jgi:hypothetical protein
MPHINNILNKTVLGITIMVQMVFFPLPSLAQSTTEGSQENSTSAAASGDSISSQSTDSATNSQTASDSTTTATATPQDSTTSSTKQTTQPSSTGITAPTSPTGADSKAYTYNHDTGMWENEHYAWDPATKKTTPKQEQSYSYNPSTGMWDTTDWQYNPASGKYEPNTVSTAQAPAGYSTTSSNSPASTQLGVSNTGPDSQNNIGLNSNTNLHFDSFFNARISNNFNSTAISGNAAVLQNTNGGSATSGDAQAMANIINLLQSSWGSAQNGNLMTFNSDINGNVYGDLFIDLHQLAGRVNVEANQTTDVDINVVTDTRFDNNINLDARSGSATVSGNTQAGNATTGDAAAMANVVNMINSSIATGQSFIGALNIHGNLEGDILFPPGLLEYLIAHTGPNSSTNISSQNTTNITANTTDNQTINNNITATASSGNATTSGNTQAGNATTGNATTDVTILNLTGRQVIGSNALLVFVNVMGEWVGLIMNAPSGSNSAVLASNVSGDTNVSLNNRTNVDVNQTNNSVLNNNINVNAASGDAAVTGNTIGGNATSGNATATVNLANIVNSQLSFSDWFGLLFINVFGSWRGSFGIDTEAGNRPTATPSKATPSVAAIKEAMADPENVQVFKFVPSGDSKYRVESQPSANSNSSISGGASFVAEARVELPTDETEVTSDQNESPAFAALAPRGGGSNLNMALPVAGTIAGLAILGGERLATLRQRRKLH